MFALPGRVGRFFVSVKMFREKFCDKKRLREKRGAESEGAMWLEVSGGGYIRSRAGGRRVYFCAVSAMASPSCSSMSLMSV